MPGPRQGELVVFRELSRETVRQRERKELRRCKEFVALKDGRIPPGSRGSTDRVGISERYHCCLPL